MHVSIKAEDISHFVGLPINNSIFSTFVLLLLFIALLIVFKAKPLKQIPSGFQNVMEFIIEALDNLTSSIAAEKGRVFLPIIGTFFIFILFSNWMGLLPGFGSIGFKETVTEKTVLTEPNEVESGTVEVKETVEKTKEEKLIPLLRGPTADLNTTIALGILSFVLIQFYGFQFLGLAYAKKFINLKGPIDFFVGFLEIISDISKIISFAFRLFGNVFAGEVLLTVIAFLTSGLAMLPFLGLEIFVGFIQALVFAMLTLVFINIATMGHEE